MIGKLRVTMIVQDYHPMLGGAQRQIASLVPLLAARQVEVSVITRRYAGLSAFENINGTPVYRLPILGAKPVAAMMFILAALPLVGRLNPHLIHAHELLSPVSAAIAAKRLYHIPVVAKVLRGGNLGDLAKLKQKPFGWQRIASARRWIDSFIVISKEIDRELDEVGVPVERRSFIPNGVDVERFAPLSLPDKQQLRANMGLPVTGPIAVYTGRLSPEKRVDALVSLWQTIRVSHPAAELLILGAGGEDDRLRKMASAGTHFVGQVDDVVPFLQVSDLFVLPSATEGLSNALLEAMSCGLPTVATSVGGAPDVIVHQESGWLIPPDTVNELYEGILILLDDVARREKMAAKAREKMICEYSLQSTADRLKKLYQKYMG